MVEPAKRPPSVTPDIFGPIPAYFPGVWAPGSYVIRFDNGAMSYTLPSDGWRLNFGFADNWYYQVNGSTVNSVLGDNNGAYTTQNALETAYSKQSEPVTLETAATVAVLLLDDPYTDNGRGTITPSFTLLPAGAI